MFEILVKWENASAGYIPQGWTHYKREYSYKTVSKFFERFIDAMRYAHNLDNYPNAVEVWFINHKTEAKTLLK